MVVILAQNSICSCIFGLRLKVCEGRYKESYRQQDCNRHQRRHLY